MTAPLSTRERLDQLAARPLVAGQNDPEPRRQWSTAELEWITALVQTGNSAMRRLMRRVVQRATLLQLQDVLLEQGYKRAVYIHHYPYQGE